MSVEATGFTVRPDSRVSPLPVATELRRLVARVQRVPWPLWTEPGARTRREVAELCRLQAARGLTVLSWLAACQPERSHTPERSHRPDRSVSPMPSTGADTGAGPGLDLDWLLATTRLAGPRQERMYAAAEHLPGPVRGLVVANWSWALATSHGGQVTAAYLASGAYPDDGYSAAHATVALLRLWERQPGSRHLLAAAWAATRTPADWCKAAELRSAYGTEVPTFTYPRAPLPPRTAVRPWVLRLLGLTTAREDDVRVAG